MTKFYRSFDEFHREEIRPLTQIGFSIDEFEIDNGFQDDFLFAEQEDEEEEEE